MPFIIDHVAPSDLAFACYRDQLDEYVALATEFEAASTTRHLSYQHCDREPYQ